MYDKTFEKYDTTLMQIKLFGTKLLFGRVSIKWNDNLSTKLMQADCMSCYTHYNVFS